ncbi:hypothetical protein [Macrococcoides bohemicum]|uniref:hypothetical protein n=1 Tax=Macrococcoides bohemicum TaxID=1903056 RepID=UPI0028A21047|nr:hypothetical protein [Macrococcus bohemicus]
MNELIKQFLEFRKQFTKKQWHEINQLVDSRFNKKAAELQLDDEDIEIILKQLESSKCLYTPDGKSV